MTRVLLAARPTLLVATKVEDDAARRRAVALAAATGLPVLPISSATGQGVPELVLAIHTLLQRLRAST